MFPPSSPTIDPGFTCSQDSMVNKTDYVELGLACADVCRALDRGMSGRRVDEINQSVFEAIGQLTVWVEPANHTSGHSLTKLPDRRAVAEIQKNIVKRGKRNGVSWMFHAKDDKEAIATWRLDLTKILHVFNVRSVTPVRPPLTIRFQTELAINTNVAVSNVHHDVLNTHVIVSELRRNVTNTQTIVSDIYRTMVENQGETDGKIWLVIPTTGGSSISYLRLAPLESPLPRRRGPVSDARS